VTSAANVSCYDRPNAVLPIVAGRATEHEQLETTPMTFNRGFRIHAVIFVIAMILVAAVDWYTAEPYWAHWVLGGWGLGLAAHGFFARIDKPSAPKVA
jgi:hypothetical protein